MLIQPAGEGFLITAKGVMRPVIVECLNKLDGMCAVREILERQHKERYERDEAEAAKADMADGTYGFEGDMG